MSIKGNITTTLLHENFAVFF